MRISALLLSLVLVVAAGVADARGGSSSGGGRGGFSGGGGARPAPAAPARPAAAPAPAPARTTTTTTSTTTTRTAGGGMVGGPVMYGGFGMGYGYTNGLLTGMIIGNMMHPHNTVVYTGGGTYNNNALLYPDGRVVSQSGQLVGTYQNGTFTAISNGPIVAQAAPADAVQHAPAQPVVIKQETNAGEIIAMVLLAVVIVFLIIILIGVIV